MLAKKRRWMKFAATWPYNAHAADVRLRMIFNQRNAD